MELRRVCSERLYLRDIAARPGETSRSWELSARPRTRGSLQRKRRSARKCLSPLPTCLLPTCRSSPLRQCTDPKCPSSPRAEVHCGLARNG